MAVTSIAYAESDDGWKLFVGRKDGAIAVYASGSQEPVTIFKEHSQNVCCLHVNQKATHLLSGSWDSNVMVFPISELNKSSFTVHKCIGHSLSVWALASFPQLPDVYLTAGADQTIRLWHSNQTKSIFKGHIDVVCAVNVLSNDQFLSAGNDGHIIHWDVASKSMLGRFSTKAHNYIYSMTLSYPQILTTGEEGTLEFWTMDTQPDGTLKINSTLVRHVPSYRTWNVKVLFNSDIAVSGSDGRLCIMSSDSTRHAPQDVKKAFDAEVVAKVGNRPSQMKADAAEVVTIKVDVDDRPTQLNLIYRKGTDPGLCALEFIQQKQLPMHYLEEITKLIKERIPEARAYDEMSNNDSYFLEINLASGLKLKFRVKKSENIHLVAQRFLLEYGLPDRASDSVAQRLSNEIEKKMREMTYPPPAAVTPTAPPKFQYHCPLCPATLKDYRQSLGHLERHEDTLTDNQIVILRWVGRQ